MNKLFASIWLSLHARMVNLDCAAQWSCVFVFGIVDLRVIHGTKFTRRYVAVHFFDWRLRGCCCQVGRVVVRQGPLGLSLSTVNALDCDNLPMFSLRFDRTRNPDPRRQPLGGLPRRSSLRQLSMLIDSCCWGHSTISRTAHLTLASVTQSHFAVLVRALVTYELLIGLPIG